MRLPLIWGVLALAGLWVLHGFLEDPAARTVLLVVAMGIALWTAFSLNIPPRREPEQEPLLEPPEEEEGEEEEEEGEESSAERESSERERPPS